MQYRCPKCKRKFSMRSSASSCCGRRQVEESDDGFSTFAIINASNGSSYDGGSSYGGSSYDGGSSSYSSSACDSGSSSSSSSCDSGGGF